MQFLRTLFWVVVAAFTAVLASRNWRDVTLNLWGNIQADIKLPVLLAVIFLLGLVPTLLVMRARLWQLRNRLLSAERALANPSAGATEPAGPSHQDQSRAAP